MDNGDTEDTEDAAELGREKEMNMESREQEREEVWLATRGKQERGS